jgi:uncharacterized membrane protein
MKKLLLLVCTLLVLVASSYAQFTFTSIDCPGAAITTARSINNHGEIVGVHWRRAVLIKGGECIPLAPTTVLGARPSEAFKINDRGDVVGNFYGYDGFHHGFLLSKEGVLTTLDFPGASETYAYGINESGTVAGCWNLLDSDGNWLAGHGFIWKDGSFSQVDFPGSFAATAVSGINARGDLVGNWGPDISSPILHGFVFSKKGQFISFDVPIAGSTWTQPNDINAMDQIVGLYIDAAGVLHGFLQVGATFTSVDFPGAAYTTAWGINNTGQIVGNHYDTADGPSRGYLAQPIKK